MKKLYAFLVFLTFAFLSIGQEKSSYKLNYDIDSKSFWGINAGATWNTTDVKSKYNYGFGLTLGRSFNYNYGKTFSFDFRGRYLYGNWYGQDGDTTDINSALISNSSELAKYNAAYGYGVLNFKSTQHRLAVELVMHANTLRARTGIDLFVFGGIGANLSKTTANFLDQTGNIYDYTTLPNLSVKSAESIQDKSYESDINSGLRFGVMPSVGFGLGYQFTPLFSMGFEHKTTFTRVDDFDGYEDANSKRANDLYHYTSLYLRFQFRRHTHTTTTHTTTTTPVVKNPPLITFTNPDRSGTSVTSPDFTITADILNVSETKNVIFQQDRQTKQNFQYNPATGKFTAQVYLKPGQNIFQITAINDAGTDKKETLIIYSQPISNPPVVTYIDPSFSTSNVNQPEVDIAASITEINQKSQATISLNGVPISFNFNAKNGIVSTRVNLQVGVNTITTTGTNEIGSDSKTITINYVPVTSVAQPPVVTITRPSSSGTTVNYPTLTLEADILNVTEKANVFLVQNGNYTTNFTYSTVSKKMQALVTLVPGQNVFEITAINNVGSDNEQTVIIYYKEEPKPPVVNYVNPAINPATTQSPTVDLQVVVQNIKQQNQASISLNGVPVNFNYNASSALANTQLNLQVGTNIVTTTATNEYGSDTETMTIIYSPVQQQEQPPFVYFTDPNVNPYTTTGAGFNLKGNVLNVTGSQNITFKHNGLSSHNFTFIASTGEFTSYVALIPGQNVFELIGQNTGGTASATTIIIREQQAPKPPIVTITNPATSPTQTSTASYPLAATVLNISQASQVKISLNGNPLTTFSFNPLNGNVSTFLTLVEGANVVQIIGTNVDGTDSKTTNIIYKPVATVQPPIVTFANPMNDAVSVATNTFNAVASIANVKLQSGVNVNVNGANITNFTFAPTTGLVSVNMQLNEGANTVTITGTNEAGTDTKYRTIVYKKQQPKQAPVVTFVDPIVNPTTVFSSTVAVKARVRFVTGAQQITLRINGVQTTNFTYSTSTELMEFSTGLSAGANSVEVTGKNNDGSAVATTTIVYNPSNPTKPPVVTISNPLDNPVTIATATTPIAATILNVDGSQNIVVKVNGTPTTNFLYSTVTKVLTMVMTLQPNTNTITISATNSAGQASDSRTINYKKEVVLPPLVTFVKPVANITVKDPIFTILATVANVTAGNQIQVLQDGQLLNPALWNFNPGSKEVTFNANLNIGNNVFMIQATNTVGTHAASVAIKYEVPIIVCNNPIISITNPSRSNLVIEVPQYILKATIANITSINDVEVYLNGTIQSAGSFDLGKKILSKPLTLIEGQNVIEIRAKNNCGTAKASTTITYKKKAAPCLAPILTRISPVDVKSTTEAQTIAINATVLNVTEANQIALTVNGISQATTVDLATKTIVSTINLNVGINSIKITATTLCGKAELSWEVERKVCNPPAITNFSSTVSPNATTTAEALEFTATIPYIQNNEQIKATKNGNPIAFVYSTSNSNFKMDVSLSLGINAIEIIADNGCGTDSYKFTVTRKEEVVNNPPKVTITNPATSPTTTNQDEQNMTLSTEGVTATNQLVVTVNGVQTSVDFNLSTGTGNFTATLQEGANIVVATVTNTAGIASDTRTVIYKKPVVILPPIVVITDPVVCPAVLQPGQQTIKATVANVTSASQVSVLFNNQAMEFQFEFVGAIPTISFDVSIEVGMKNIPISITGTNSAGTNTKNCTVTSAVDVPCLKPIITRVLPLTETFGLSLPVLDFVATVTSISANNQVVLTVNGVTVTTTLDLATKQIKATFNLNEGENKIVLKATNECGTTEMEWTITRSVCLKPIITRVLPLTETFSSSLPVLDFVAAVTSVSASSQVVLTVNGVVVNSSLNLATHQILATLNLNEGQNKIELKATNECGTTEMEWTVTRTVCLKPIITRVIPLTETFSINVPVLDFLATVTSISANSQVILTVNGAVVSSTFNGLTKQITAHLNLNEGENKIELKATNECGSTEMEWTVTRSVCLKPIITRVLPLTETMNISLPVLDFVATVANISANSQVVLTVNGVVVTSAFNAATKQITADLNLNEGENKIELKATNECGSNEMEWMVTRSACLKPIITRVLPLTETFGISLPVLDFVATVANISANSQVVLTVNGVVVTSSFNAATKQITATLNLNEGENKIELKATNECGSTEMEWTVTRSTCLKPIIARVLPLTETFELSVPILDFVATVSKVSSSSSIELVVNGNTVNTNYEVATQQVKASITLVDGENIIVLKAVNNCGDSEMKWTVNRSICLKPVIARVLPLTETSGSSLPTIDFLATVANIKTNGQVTLTVNNVVVITTYNALTKQVKAAVNLKEGSNTIKLKANNECGDEEMTWLVSRSVCFKPVIARLTPSKDVIEQSIPKLDFAASVSNITANSQVVLKLNGNVIATSFEALTKQIKSSITLDEGVNKIELKATNECGDATMEWTVNKTPCLRPELIRLLPLTEELTLGISFLDFAAIIGNLTTNITIELTVNGKKVTANLDAASKQVKAKIELTESENIIELRVSNECGESVLTTKVKKSILSGPVPTLKIVNPVDPTYTTKLKEVTIEILTSGMGVLDKIDAKVNGKKVEPNFNLVTKTARFIAKVVPGQNTVTATVTTAGGTASDSRIIICNAPTNIEEEIPAAAAPVIKLFNPRTCPAIYPVGQASIAGVISNVQRVDQVAILFNNSRVVFQSNLSGTNLTFTASIPITSATIQQQLSIQVKADGGTASENCSISVDQQSVTRPVDGGRGSSGEIPTGGGTNPKPSNPTTPMKPAGMPTTTPTRPSSNPTIPTTKPVSTPSVPITKPVSTPTSTPTTTKPTSVPAVTPSVPTTTKPVSTPTITPSTPSPTVTPTSTPTKTRPTLTTPTGTAPATPTKIGSPI